MNRNLVGSIYGWDDMSNLYRGPTIDASYQVSVHLAEGFQRRRLKCEKLTNEWVVLYKLCSFRPNPLTNMATTGNSCFRLADLKKSSPLKSLGQMNLNLVWSIYGRFSIKMGVSEEKIKMWKVNRRRMPSDGKSSHCLWQGELKKTTISNNLVCTIWSGITLIRYASSQNIGKSNNLCLVFEMYI
jgi:hypothetical protein